MAVGAHSRTATLPSGGGRRLRRLDQSDVITDITLTHPNQTITLIQTITLTTLPSGDGRRLGQSDVGATLTLTLTQTLLRTLALIPTLALALTLNPTVPSRTP